MIRPNFMLSPAPAGGVYGAGSTPTNIPQLLEVFRNPESSPEALQQTEDALVKIGAEADRALNNFVDPVGVDSIPLEGYRHAARAFARIGGKARDWLFIFHGILGTENYQYQQALAAAVNLLPGYR